MARFAAPDKRRPVLILSRTKALEHLRTATVAPITSTIRGLPSEVRLGVTDGLKHDSAVNLDHIVTLPQSSLRQWVSRVGDLRMREVCEALQIALGCR
jgi:mRNA interferase MazF